MVKKTTLLACAIAATLLLAVWVTVAPVSQARATTTLQLTKNERTLIDGINRERTKRGLHAVRVRVSLMRAARAHSVEMARYGILAHRSRSVRFGYRRCGYRVWRAGEDVGRGWVGSLWGTPQGMVSAWMHSTTHRSVILTASFRDIGVGLARAPGSSYRYFTLDLGRRID
jgi:uncharacterized protein YkwD